MPDRSPEHRLDRPLDRIRIHASALVALSAVLQAEAQYSIEIGAGVAIGEGCWLHACSGDITIESGAILGAGVLIVGWSHIGAHSTLGAATTVFEGAVATGSAIAAHSVLGLPERSIKLEPSRADVTDEVDNLPDPWSEDSNVDRETASEESSKQTTEAVPVSTPVSAFGPPVANPEPKPPITTTESSASETDSPLAEESEQSGLPDLVAPADETTEAGLETRSTTPHVYGRQHVSRIIDSILKRNP